MDENKNTPSFPSGFDSVSNLEKNNDLQSAENLTSDLNSTQNEVIDSSNDTLSSAKNEEKEESSSKDFIPNGTYSYSAKMGNLKASAFNEPATDTNEGNTVPPTPSINDQTFERPVVNASGPNPIYHRPPQNKKGRFSPLTVIISATLALILGISGGFVGTYLASNLNKDKQNTPSNIQQNITNITVDETVNSTTEAVAKKSGPSVVGIRTTAAVTNFFFGTSEATEEGSGIIYTADGYIITNYHVIESAVESSNSKVEVFLPDNTEKSFSAAVIGYNISSDLAVVKIEANNLPAIEFADSANLTVGQTVIAIGNPGGLEFIGSVSTGVISGLNRSITVGTGATMSLIQTDAAINPGNSGGALVNTSGQLIGVNSVKLVSEGYEGMGFAIPSNTVKEICDKIISKQNDPTPYIGIQISQSYTAAQLKELGYPAGAVVVSVVAGSPAADAGIERGDIITEYNGKTIQNYTDLDDTISDSNPGDSVTVKLYRAGKFYSTTVKVEANNSR